MIKDPKSTFPAAKKGKLRMYARPIKLSKNKNRGIWKKTPYVRHDIRKVVRKRSQQWSWNLDRIAGLSDKKLISNITNIKNDPVYIFSGLKD